MLQFSVQYSGNAVILKCAGRMVAGDSLLQLQATAMAQRAPALVIDLEGVEALDAAGLGALLRVREWCDSQGMSIRLTHPTKRVQEVLALTALDSVLEVQSATKEDELCREWVCAGS